MESVVNQNLLPENWIYMYDYGQTKELHIGNILEIIVIISRSWLCWNSWLRDQ